MRALTISDCSGNPGMTVVQPVPNQVCQHFARAHLLAPYRSIPLSRHPDTQPAIVSAVDRDGAAWAAGVRPGDQLWDCNGKPVRPVPFPHLSAISCRSGLSRLGHSRSRPLSPSTVPPPAPDFHRSVVSWWGPVPAPSTVVSCCAGVPFHYKGVPALSDVALTAGAWRDARRHQRSAARIGRAAATRCRHCPPS
jgi:hypothetical protein